MTVLNSARVNHITHVDNLPAIIGGGALLCKQLKKRLSDPMHRRLHRRRAQTEARIGVFKSSFLGDHLPTKNFESQQRYIAWATLSHNLWVLARLNTADAAIVNIG